MEIELPNLEEQKQFVFEQQTNESINRLLENLKAPRVASKPDINESLYPNTHLLALDDGWETPSPEIVRAYFDHFQAIFPEYDTDRKLSTLLGLSGQAGHARIREYKKVNGKKTIPYGIWRKFLVITGRVPQTIEPVFTFFK
jgi:hypothetical protein